MNEQEAQQKYIELQLLEQQVNQLQHQFSLLEQQSIELKSLSENIEEIKNIKINTRTFSSLGNGIFLESELKDNKELLVNVGANVIVKKSIEDTKKIITNQTLEIDKLKAQIEEQLQKLTIHSIDLQEELSKLNQ